MVSIHTRKAYLGLAVRSYVYDDAHTFVPVCWFLLFSCSHFLDNAVQIWDVRRPYIPFGSFVEHTDDVTGKIDRRHDGMPLNVSQCESRLGYGTLVSCTLRKKLVYTCV